MSNNYLPPTAEEIAAAKATGRFTATMTTEKGVITLELDGAEAPIHVANFVKLARANFYHGVVFHRVVENFVIQTGDPQGNGMGGPGYQINFEKNNLQHNDGALGMARSQDLNSAGSQFYICLGPQHFLDANYVVFGRATAGLDVVKSIVEGDKVISVVID